jgi:hypothetical protein
VFKSFKTSQRCLSRDMILRKKFGTSVAGTQIVDAVVHKI